MRLEAPKFAIGSADANALCVSLACGMPASWVAAAFLETKKHFRRIMAYKICEL